MRACMRVSRGRFDELDPAPVLAQASVHAFRRALGCNVRHASAAFLWEALAAGELDDEARGRVVRKARAVQHHVIEVGRLVADAEVLLMPRLALAVGLLDTGARRLQRHSIARRDASYALVD